MMKKNRITDNMDALINVFPSHIADELLEIDRADDLLEVILDVGRIPTARFVDGEVTLSEREVTFADIDKVVSRLGDFDDDNRAGITRTLHRISAIRNRHGRIVGLTCRVGRAVYGTIDIIQDLVSADKSLLLLGRPGIGKTTMLREAARILAETRRVVIVDTSNEIAGDGDVPHPAIGRARRMQVAQPALQHEVMIEAVENHNPEVIVIDEIGRELEAAAARTIAERGVQLIGTAHGNTIENLLLNPTLSDLIGGIESVTLSDEEARRRGTQKTVLERRAAPTFDVLIEIQSRVQMAVHLDVSSSVDALLRGRPLIPQVRTITETGEVKIQKTPAAPGLSRGQEGYRRQEETQQADRSRLRPLPSFHNQEDTLPYSPTPPHLPGKSSKKIRIFPYAVAKNRLRQSVKRLGVQGVIVETLAEADVLVTLRANYRNQHKVITDAENRRMPIYVLRSNTVGQMENFLIDLFSLNMPSADDPELGGAMEEARSGIQEVLNGAQSVELKPASSYIRRLQHQMARQADLISHSYGKEPNRRVRVYRS